MSAESLVGVSKPLTRIFEGCDSWWMLFRVRSRTRELDVTYEHAMDLLYCLEEWACTRDLGIGAGDWTHRKEDERGCCEWVCRPSIQPNTDPAPFIPRAIAEEWIEAVLIPWARLHGFDAIGRAFPMDSGLVMREWVEERERAGSEGKPRSWRSPVERVLDVKAIDGPAVEPAPAALDDVVGLLHAWAAPHGLRARAALVEQDSEASRRWRIRVWFSKPRSLNGAGVKARVMAAARDVAKPWADRYGLTPTIDVRTPGTLAEEVREWTGPQGPGEPTSYSAAIEAAGDGARNLEGGADSIMNPLTTSHA